jgi:hypothetical protein
MKEEKQKINFKRLISPPLQRCYFGVILLIIAVTALLVYRYTQASDGKSNEGTNYALFNKEDKYTIEYIAPPGFEKYFKDLPRSYNGVEEIELILDPAIYFAITWTSTVDGKAEITTPKKNVAITIGDIGNRVYTAISDYAKLDYDMLDYSKLDHSKLDYSKLDYAKLDYDKLDYTKFDILNNLTIARLKIIPEEKTPAIFVKDILLPVLSTGLTPVVYDSTLNTERKVGDVTYPAYWKAATTIDEWYDYSTGTRRWANAVTKDRKFVCLDSTLRV